MSSIAVVKATQGFMPANQRPACRNCKHGNEQSQDRSDKFSLSCKKGGFYVTALAVCDEHQPKREYLDSLHRMTRAEVHP